MPSRLFLLMICFLSYVRTDAQSWKKDIESSVDALNKAMIAQDQPTLDKLTAEELSYGHSTSLVENKTAFLKAIMAGSPKFIQIDDSARTISLAGNEAIVRNICLIAATKDGSPLNLRLGVLMVWKKDGASWKLLARQGYKLP